MPVRNLFAGLFRKSRTKTIMAPISLPQCEGPSLGPFPHNIIDSEFEFLKVLDCDSRHGVVVKARWRKRLYAIKLFVSEERSPIDYEDVYSPDYPELCSEAFDWHFTPFENECRAFGRLQEFGCEHLAVKVHGYVQVTSDQIKKKLPSEERKLFHDLTFSRNVTPEMMGIVKDWVEMVEYKDEELRSLYDRFCQIFHIPRMIEDLQEMHKNGIVVRDLRSDQYVNSVLVDLSCAATAPHPYGPPSEYQPLWTFSSLAAWDLFSFQWQIITLWNKDYKYMASQLDKPQGMPNVCPFTAYDYPLASKAARKRATLPYGPFLPLMNLFENFFLAIKPPRWDPLKYLENRHSENQKRKRSEEAGQSLEKRVGKMQI